jgi:hypothetical protein
MPTSRTNKSTSSTIKTIRKNSENLEIEVSGSIAQQRIARLVHTKVSEFEFPHLTDEQVLWFYVPV